MNNFGQGAFSPNNGFSNGNNYSTGNNFFSSLNVNNFPHYDVVKVNGRSGAEAFQMGPNSRYLLVDDKDPIIWFVQTDGAGYKNITPYAISPYQPAPPVDLNALETRISALEDKINAKSYTGTNKQSRKQLRTEQSMEDSTTSI